MHRYRITLLIIVIFLGACSSKKDIKQDLFPTKYALKFLGDQEFSNHTKAMQYLLGGLSGLLYRPVFNELWAISDDWKGFPRFFKFKVSLQSGVPRLTLFGVQPLKDEFGNIFPKQNYDSEAITLGPKNTLLITHEGSYDSARTYGRFTRYPEINEFSFKGQKLSYVRPPKIVRKAYHNLTLESLFYDFDNGLLVAGMENPLTIDGGQIDFKKPGFARIFVWKWNPAAKVFHYVKEKAYPLSSIKWPKSVTEQKKAVADWRNHGLVDMIKYGDDWLSMERSYIAGLNRNHTMLYRVKPDKGQDIRGIIQLHKNKIVPLEKELLSDFDSLIPRLKTKRLDNFEGMSIGPKLPNGNDTLIVVSDNNFNASQRTVFLFFEIVKL